MAPEKKRSGPPVQVMASMLQGGVLVIPDQADELAKEIVSGYGLFRRSRGNIRIVDSRTGVEVVVNHSWGPVRGRAGNDRNQISATLIYAPEGEFPSGEKIDESMARQRQLASVFIVEQGRKSAEEREERKSILQRRGLVEAAVSTRGTGDASLTISRARRKKPTRRTPIDITTTRANYKLQEGEKRERRGAKIRGAELVSNAPAKKLATASINIPRDASNLADGRGRTYREACGCIVETDLKGATTIRHHCNGGACVLRGEVEPDPVIPWEQLRTLNYVIVPETKKREAGETFTNGSRRYRVAEARNPKGKVIKVGIKIV